MAFELVKRMFSKKREEEDNVAEKVFGNVIKFRVGSSINISGHVLDLFPENTLFAQANQADYSTLIVESVFSFDFDTSKIWRLYCSPIGVGEDCIVQIQEDGKGVAHVMLFLLTQEEGLTDQTAVDSWIEFMGNEEIPYTLPNEENVQYTKLFGPLNYMERFEIEQHSTNRPSSANKTMALFEHEVEDQVEYLLFDFNGNDWYLEGFAGINIPREEIQVS